MQRRHLADLYDLILATFVNRDLEVDRAELLATFFKLTVFGAEPNVAKGLLLDLPLGGIKRFWHKYVAAAKEARFSFEDALTNLRSLVEGLFVGPAEEWSAVLFPARIRNPIIICADSFLMVRMSYKGRERLVEPYSMKFKVRKDGTARE